MTLYVNQKRKSMSIKGNDSFEGISIEKEMAQLKATGNTPKQNLTQIFYTQKKDGALPSTNIRTDKWEIAQKAMEQVNNEFQKRIQENIKGKEAPKKETPKAE